MTARSRQRTLACRRSALAALGMLLLLPACVTEGVTDQAYSALRGSGVFEQMVERTGLDTLAENAATRYAQAMSADDVPLDTVGVPLSKLATGIVTGPRPPDLVRAALTEIAAEHGPALARRMMIGAFTGGATVVTGLPSMANGAMAAHEKLVAAQEAQVVIDAAYATAEATRAETTLVPDADRSFEASALLELVNQPAGTSFPHRVTWDNPKTGASGAVALGAVETGEGRPGTDPVTCRTVLREYVQGTISRSGLGTICREGAVWYDLS